jgi:hypothetical protein
MNQKQYCSNAVNAIPSTALFVNQNESEIIREIS